VLAALIGAALAIVLGYIVYAAPKGADGGARFGWWLQNPLFYDVFWWALFGAAIACAIVYVTRLERD